MTVNRIMTLTCAAALLAAQWEHRAFGQGAETVNSSKSSLLPPLKAGQYESQVGRAECNAPARASYAKLVGQTALVLAGSAAQQAQQRGAEVASTPKLTAKKTKEKGKASYWFSPAPPLNKQTLSLYRDLAKQEWLKRFESLPALVPPPTWPDWDIEFEKGLADLAGTLGAKLRVSSLTVGKRGWETSSAEKLPPRFPFQPDPGKNMEPAAWFKKLATVSQSKHLGVSIEMLSPGARARFQDLAGEFTTNIVESAKGKPAGGTFALWVTLAFEEFGGREPIVQTVKNVRDKVDYIAWMDTRRLFEKHGMELCRQRVRELVELCGKDKLVIQVGISSQELSPYPKDFMAMCREEGVGIFFLYVSKPVLGSAEWKEFVRELP